MTRQAPIKVEHYVDPENGVAILVGPLPSRPTAWRALRDGSCFGVGFADARPLYFSLPPAHLAEAARRGRMLVVEVCSPPRETWVAMQAAPAEH